MDFNDLQKLYDAYRETYGEDAYKKISVLLQEAKVLHKHDWDLNPTEKGDHDQSWRAFKGKNLEKLIEYIVKSEVEDLGLKIINGNKLERSKNLTGILARVKNNLIIDYAELGEHLPDVDLVIYYPESGEVLAIISSKVTLRERIAQPGYWAYKLKENDLTKHIKFFFISPDEDGTLTIRFPTKKGRAIVETEFDTTYVLTEANLEESENVKLFEHFIEDLKAIR